MNADRDIKIFYDNLQPDSLLLSFGDHGGTKEGRHGGGSKDELESGLLAYSQKNFTFVNFKYPDKLPKTTQELIKILGSHLDLNFLNRKAFNQVDGVSTLSAIFNTPIPHSNLGIIIPELLHYDNCIVAGCLYELTMDFVLNYAQVMNYVETFIQERNIMQDQLEIMTEAFSKMKTDIQNVMKNHKFIIEIEENYINGNEMSDSNKNEYIKFVDDMFKIMGTIRSVLTKNSLAFKEEWSSISGLYLYSSLAIRIIISVGIIFAVIFFYMNDMVNLLDFANSHLTKVYTFIGLISLFVIIYYNMEYLTLFLIIVFGICIWFTQVLINLYKKYSNPIWVLLKSEAYSLPTFFAIGVLALHTCLYTFLAREQESTLFYITCTTFIMCFILILKSGIRNNRFLITCFGVIVCCRISLNAANFQITNNYVNLSAIPSFLILGLGLYFIFVKTSPKTRKIIKIGFGIFFITESIGMMYYQFKEYNKTYKDTHFSYIILPRSIFALSVFQIFFLFVSLCFKPLLWSELPSKKERIFTFFTFLLTATVPSLLMLVGPNQPIYYLCMLMVAYGLSYILKEIGQSNSLFFCVFYFFMMHSFYHSTGHILDFMALRVQRAFVGFPNFKTEINFPIVFFETTGTFALMMALVPFITIYGKSNEGKNEYKKCKTTPESELTSIKTISEDENDKSDKKPANSNDDSKLEAMIWRNYLMILLCFELSHDGLTKYLITHFDSMFFSMSPTEFTFRFIDWYIFILVFIFEYIIGRI